MKTPWGVAIIMVALIWAAVILATSMAMKNAPEYPRLLNILGGGAAATIILLGGMAVQERKAR